MAYTTVDNPSKFFNTVLWTGNGTDNTSITGVGFQPDFLWGKQRNTARSHRLINSSISTHYLASDNTNAEASVSGLFDSFDSDGFTIDDASALNQSSGTYVGWNWKANGGTTSSDSNGSITSTVQANTTAGFSIVTYTGNGTDGATVGHGLTSPDLILIKNRDSSLNWHMFGYGGGLQNIFDANNKTLVLNDTAAINAAGSVGVTLNSSTFTINDAGTPINESSSDLVAYVFKSIQGYSKFGSYTGNGNADGVFVYTGFRPAWFMVKLSSGSGEDWHIFDSKRSTSNVVKERLIASGNAAENANDSILDFVSNGFKFRENNAGWNGNGNTYIYMAFAEHPFVSSKGVPTTAR